MNFKTLNEQLQQFLEEQLFCDNLGEPIYFTYDSYEDKIYIIQSYSNDGILNSEDSYETLKDANKIFDRINSDNYYVLLKLILKEVPWGDTFFQGVIIDEKGKRPETLNF